ESKSRAAAHRSTSARIARDNDSARSAPEPAPLCPRAPFGDSQRQPRRSDPPLVQRPSRSGVEHRTAAAHEPLSAGGVFTPDRSARAIINSASTQAQNASPPAAIACSKRSPSRPISLIKRSSSLRLSSCKERYQD